MIEEFYVALAPINEENNSETSLDTIEENQGHDGVAKMVEMPCDGMTSIEYHILQVYDKT